MTAVLRFAAEIETITCADCGLMFGAPPAWLRARRNDKVGFVCPNGHALSFRESEADRLRKKLEESQRELAAKESALVFQRGRAERAEQAQAKSAAKLKRVKNGVCPCCRRNFVALQRHMKAKHPEWTP